MPLPEHTTLNWGPWYRRSPYFEATLRAAGFETRIVSLLPGRMLSHCAVEVVGLVVNLVDPAAPKPFRRLEPDRRARVGPRPVELLPFDRIGERPLELAGRQTGEVHLTAAGRARSAEITEALAEIEREAAAALLALLEDDAVS